MIKFKESTSVVADRAAKQTGNARSPSMVKHFPATDPGQRVLGNQGMLQQQFGNAPLQAKLKIGQVNDKYEQEADRVADRVLNMSGAGVADISPGGPQIQRACAQCSASGTRCPQCEEDELLQRKPEPGSSPSPMPATGMVNNSRDLGSRGLQSGPSVEQQGQIEQANDAGQPLPATVRSFFEPRFGHDFGHVRIHTNHSAVSAASSIHARAFTRKNHIVFGAGEYAPHSSSGRKLLAHELTHTIQQNDPMVDHIMRLPEPEHCTDIDRTIDKVVVQQETPQSATIYWNDGSVESDICSTGKGTCCVPANDPGGIGATVAQSRAGNSNWTPITEGRGYQVYLLDANHNGIPFWTEFNHRHIALHAYRPVDGTPLSHGCVRLREEFARKIYCGSRENQTWVQVRGYARPRCNWPNLIQEWRGDMHGAVAHLDGEETDPDIINHNRTAYRLMQRSFGEQGAALEGHLRGINQGDDAAVAAAITRCSSTGAAPTSEESRLYDYGIPAQQLPRVQRLHRPVNTPVPVTILAESGFHQRLTPFTTALSGATSLSRARRVVIHAADNLWQAAVDRAQQTSGAVLDDRPLYWSRLELVRALRQWEPRFRLSSAQRDRLIELFERHSRGMTSIDFSAAEEGQLKVLITGFDPFLLDPNSPLGDISRSNPSGAAVLALDGTNVSNGSLSARIEGAIFPVRFRDFDQGIVEDVIRPFIQGDDPVDMVMTISQGGSRFELEQFAGRNRFVQTNGQLNPRHDPFVRDNLGRIEGLHFPTLPRDMIGDSGISAAEFRASSLPMQVIRDTLQQAGITTIDIDRHVEEVIVSDSGEMTVHFSTSGPTAGSSSLKGSGGGFLSNEISYRTLRLRDTSTNTELPVGHLHVPGLGANPEAERVQIKNTVQRIIMAALPELQRQP